MKCRYIFHRIYVASENIGFEFIQCFRLTPFVQHNNNKTSGYGSTAWQGSLIDIIIELVSIQL